VRLPDEDEVRAEIIEKVNNYGRVGYRKVTHMLQRRAQDQPQAGGADLAGRRVETAAQTAQEAALVPE